MGSAGCGKTSTVTFGTVPNEPPNGYGTGGWVTIPSSGQTRGFAMRLPDNYDGSHPYWLIFSFHWVGGTASAVDNGGTNMSEASYFGLQKLSNNGAFFVAPQGLDNGWANAGGQDVQFVDDMLKLIEDNYCVDTTHIIAQGFSYGASMSFAIACARASVFHAVVLYEGAEISGCAGGNAPIAYMQSAGLTDTTFPLSVATPLRDMFVQNNGCTSQNPPQPPAPPPYLDPGGHVCTDYAGCSSGHPLRWCVHQSGHTPAPEDGNSDLDDTKETSWTPGSVWQWLTSF